MRNCTVLLLVVCLVVSSFSVLAVSSVSAQAGYKPSVPQISSVKIVDSSYDVPPSSTKTVDQYTGKETTNTKPGYHVNQKSIEITIKNQPFTPYTGKPPYSGDDGIEKTFNLYYTVEVKGHFGEYWQQFGESFVVQSNSGHTVVSSAVVGQGTSQVNVIDCAAGSRLDFRVRACIGHKYDASPSIWFWDPVWTVAPIEYSEWSSVKTFVMPDGALLSPPSQTATWPPLNSDDNDQPHFPDQTQPLPSIFSNPLFMLVVGVLLGVVVAAVVMVFLRRHIKTPTYTNNLPHQISGVKGLYA